MKFTIRDVLWLTVVVALAAGWGVNRQRLVAHTDIVEENVRSLRPWAEDHPAVMGIFDEGGGRLGVLLLPASESATLNNP